MKIVIAGFAQETNSFSRIITDRAIFNAHMPILKGEEILNWDTSTNVELSGMLHQLRQYDAVEICPAIVAQSVSGMGFRFLSDGPLNFQKPTVLEDKAQIEITLDKTLTDAILDAVRA